MKSLFSIILLSLLAINLNAQSLVHLYEKVNASVATIYVVERVSAGTGDPLIQTSNEGLGSGVLIREDVVLTATHVVNNASKIIVEFPDGQKFSAKPYRTSVVADVAIIKLDRPVKNIIPSKLADSDSVQIGEDVFVIGAPLGLTHSLSRGIISGRRSEKNLSKNLNKLEFFQTDAAINQGNSGGPMYNMDGEVIGIVSSILSFSGGFEGVGFAATSKIAYNLLTQKSSVWFGLDAFPLSYELCKIFNVPQEGAILIQNVAEGSPAYFMGMKGGFLKMSVAGREFIAGGDILLSFDGIELSSDAKIEEFKEHLNNVPERHMYKIKVLRNGEIKELKWQMSE